MQNVGGGIAGVEGAGVGWSSACPNDSSLHGATVLVQGADQRKRGFSKEGAKKDSGGLERWSGLVPGKVGCRLVKSGYSEPAATGPDLSLSAASTP